MSSRTPAAAGALAAAGLVTLALAAPASAGTPEYYGVEVDATIHTSWARNLQSPTHRLEAGMQLDTRLTSGFLAIVTREPDGRISAVSGEDQHHATTTGTGSSSGREWSDFGSGSWFEYGTSCVGAGEAKNDEGRTSLVADPLAPLNRNAAMVLNLADQLQVDVRCDTTGRDGAGSGGPSSFSLTSPLPDDPYTQAFGRLSVPFELPPEALAAGKTIQLFEGPVEGGAWCPEDLADRGENTACNVTFRGTITFTADPTLNGAPGGGGAPVRPVPSTPAPPAPPKVSDEDDLLVPLVPAKQQARLNAKKGTLTFKAACRNGCSGKATIQAPARKGGSRAAHAKKAAKAKKLAVVSFSVPKGTTARTVTVKLPAKARKAAKKAKGATVALSLQDRGTKRTTKATLKVAR